MKGDLQRGGGLKGNLYFDDGVLWSMCSPKGPVIYERVKIEES